MKEAHMSISHVDVHVDSDITSALTCRDRHVRSHVHGTSHVHGMSSMCAHLLLSL